MRNGVSKISRFGRAWIVYIISLYRYWFVLLAIAAMIAIGVVIWMTMYPLCGERAVRLSGLILQLLGFGVVAYGLLSKAKLFSYDSLRGLVVDAWGRRPRFSPKNVVIEMQGIASGTSFGAARGRGLPDPNASLDTRVTVLQQNVETLFDEVDRLDTQVKTNATSAAAAIERERTERDLQNKKNQRQFREALFESIHLEVSGVAFFVVGIIAGTASSEIAGIFGKMSSCSLP